TPRPDSSGGGAAPVRNTTIRRPTVSCIDVGEETRVLQRPPVGGGHGAAHVDPALASGRVAGLLMIACGLYTFVTVLLPTPFGFNTIGVVTVAVIAVAAGVLVRRLPWD